MSDLSDLMNDLNNLKVDLITQQKAAHMKYQDSIQKIGTMQNQLSILINTQNVPRPPAPAVAPVTKKVAQREVRPADQRRPGDKRSQFGCSDRQSGFILQLLDDKFARLNPNDCPLTMLGASQVIDQLKSLPDVPDDQRDLTTVPVQAVVASMQPEPEPEPVKDKINLNVLKIIPDGRYAVTSSDASQTVFLKLSTRNKSNGYPHREVRYKSAESWHPLQQYYPSGQVTGRNEIHGSVVADLLTQVMMDVGGSADRYGERFAECVNCGRELTDDRSRYYHLGSECVQKRADVVEYVDRERGPWTPGAASQD